MVTGVITKVIGTQLLRDVQTFVAAFDTMFGGFRERADDTYRLLQAPGTAFLVIATPEPDALREASYFVERLSSDQMPLAGLIVNRVHRSAAPQLSAARSMAAAEALQAVPAAPRRARPPAGPSGRNGTAAPAATASRYPLTATALRLHAERMQLAAREKRLKESFTDAHPVIPVTEVPAQPQDVHDLEGLRAIGNALNGAGG